MKDTTRKVLQVAWIAGTIAWFGSEIYEMINTIKVERGKRAKIQEESEARIAAFNHAQEIICEEIDAGHYDKAGYTTLMKDFGDLVNLQVPDTY